MYIQGDLVRNIHHPPASTGIPSDVALILSAQQGFDSHRQRAQFHAQLAIPAKLLSQTINGIYRDTIIPFRTLNANIVIGVQPQYRGRASVALRNLRNSGAIFQTFPGKPNTCSAC